MENSIAGFAIGGSKVADTNPTPVQDRVNEPVNERVPERVQGRGQEPQETEASRPPRRRRAILVVAIAAVVLIALGIWWHSTYYEDTDDAQVNGHLTQVSSRIAGHITRVYVDENQEVHRGDPIVDLDPRDFQVAVENAQAELASAKAAAAAARVNVPIISVNTGSNLSSAQADLAGARAGEVGLRRTQVAARIHADDGHVYPGRRCCGFGAGQLGLCVLHGDLKIARVKIDDGIATVHFLVFVYIDPGDVPGNARADLGEVTVNLRIVGVFVVGGVPPDAQRDKHHGRDSDNKNASPAPGRPRCLGLLRFLASSLDPLRDPLVDRFIDSILDRRWIRVRHFTSSYRETRDAVFHAPRNRARS